MGDKTGFCRSSHNYVNLYEFSSASEIIFCVVLQCNLLSNVYSQVVECMYWLT